MRLGELLVVENGLSPQQVQAARRRQIIHGGRLGSNLVELGFIGLEDLAIALGQHHQLPAALQNSFNHLDPRLVEKLTPEMAASWHAVPLGRTGHEGRQIAIATTDPFDPDVLYELESIFDAEIVQAISPELRLLYWLEEVYQIQRINRYKRSRESGNFTDPPTDPERRAVMQTLSDTDSVCETSALARVAVKRVTVPISGEMQLPIDPENLDDCCRAIRQATGRARMADIVTEVLEQGFGCAFSAAILLTVREDLAIGWRGFVREQPQKSVDVLAVPLCSDSMFVAPTQNGEVLCGLPSAPSIIDKRLWQFLGAAPADLLIVPIEVSENIEGLLYVQCDGPILAEYAGGLGDLCRALSAGLTRLIRADSR